MTPMFPMPTAPRRRVLLLVAGLLFALLPAGPASAQANPGTTGPKRIPRLSTPLFSARRVPNLLRANIADQKLAAAITALMADGPVNRCIEITAHGRPIFRENGDVPLEPASTNKLLTATGVLQNMKPDAALVTSARAVAPAEGGVVNGNLFLVGGGDALLTTAGYKPTLEDQNQYTSDLNTLADNIKAAGITEVRGDIVGDDSRYDAVRYVATWPNRYKAENTVGPLSALMVNDGVTGYSKSPDKPSRVYKPGDPPALAAETLKTMLTDRGIAVTGNPVAGVAPPGSTEIASMSALIADEVGEMLSWSDNTTAEALTKEIGVVTGGGGTTAAGTQATIDTLTKMGVPTAGLIMRDGSGLDDGNRLTCDLLNGLLDRQGPDSVLAKGLPVSAKSGTLRKRMRGTPAAGQVFAKTGTLTNPPVVSLAGFITTRAGDTLTFSFVQNGLKSDASLQDQLALAMFEYPQAPDLTELLPKPPAA